MTRGTCAVQRSISIKEARELQEDFTQQAQDQLQTFQQTAKSAREAESPLGLSTSQRTSSSLVLPPKQLPERGPAPNNRHLRQIVRSGSTCAPQVLPPPADAPVEHGSLALLVLQWKLNIL